MQWIPMLKQVVCMNTTGLEGLMQIARETRSLNVSSKLGVPIVSLSYRAPNITTDIACNAVRHLLPGQWRHRSRCFVCLRGRQDHNATVSTEMDSDGIWQKQGMSLWFPLKYRFGCYCPQTSCGARLIGIICPVLIELCVGDLIRWLREEHFVVVADIIGVFSMSDAPRHKQQIVCLRRYYL